MTHIIFTELEDLQEMDNNYEMKCARHGLISSCELHPCFYCGKDILVSKASHCIKCGHLICPHCDRCDCNITRNEQATLAAINIKYCITPHMLLDFYGVEIESWMDVELALNMERALFRCSKRFALEVRNANIPGL